VEEIRKTVFRQGSDIEALGIETHNFEMRWVFPYIIEDIKLFFR